MTKNLTAPRSGERIHAAARTPLSLYWVFWVFLFAGVASDFIEVVFCLITQGELVSRSSLLYGPFSIVWGAGAVLFTLAFHHLGDQGILRIFLTGALLGGAYEYLCSWIQEIFFGVCFWDYRHLPLNLNGRVNLGFCLFWGAAAVVWVRLICPALHRLISRIPRRAGRVMAGIAAVLFAMSTVLSAAALYRMEQRQEGVPALGAVSRFLDEKFPDAVLHARYPNMKILSEIGWYDNR